MRRRPAGDQLGHGVERHARGEAEQPGEQRQPPAQAPAARRVDADRSGRRARLGRRQRRRRALLVARGRGVARRGGDGAAGAPAAGHDDRRGHDLGRLAQPLPDQRDDHRRHRGGRQRARRPHLRRDVGGGRRGDSGQGQRLDVDALGALGHARPRVLSRTRPAP